MIYELRTYTFNPGTLPAYIEHVEKVGRPVRGDDYGKCWGYWTAEFGQLNQAWHLWSYASLDERTRMREALSKNERWNEGVRAGRAADAAAAGRPLSQSGGGDQAAGARAASTNCASIARSRARPVSGRSCSSRSCRCGRSTRKYVGIWTGEAPQPNEVVHMWNYPDLNTRVKVRAEFQRNPEWQAFVAANTPKLLEMQSVLLMPTPFSALR